MMMSTVAANAAAHQAQRNGLVQESPEAKPLPSAQKKPATSETKAAKSAATPAKEDASAMHPQQRNNAPIPEHNIYDYDEASNDFKSAKTASPDAYKQFMVEGTQLKAESVTLPSGETLTRYETGAYLKEVPNNGEVVISTPSGLVIESDMMNREDVEDELMDVDSAIKEKAEIKNKPKAVETQFEHDLAEAEIWGKTLSSPEAVTINEETQDIDVQTPTGVFHLDKQDNISFEPIGGDKRIALKQVLEARPDSPTNASVAEKAPQQQPQPKVKAQAPA